MSTPIGPTHLRYAHTTLRVEPHTLPALRAAFAQAQDLLQRHIDVMKDGALITEDWLGDEDSKGLRAFYNDWVMGSPDGPFGALLNYGRLLKDIHDQLAAAEAEYRRVEGENSELWGRA